MMSLSDRIQATLRLPAYQEDFQQLFKFFQEEKFGYPDEPASKEFIRHLLETQPNIPEIARIADKWELPTAIDPDFRGDATRLEPWLGTAKTPPRKTAKPIKVKMRRPTRFLEIQVDLLERIDTLDKVFHKLVQEYQDKLPVGVIKENRGKPPKLDPWEIYDLIEVHGKTKTEIIQAMLEKARKNPDARTAYNPESMRLYKQISSAYAKAKRIMKSVTPRTP